MIDQRHERAVVMAILAAFTALALGFSMTPILEGPDEIEHYRYVRTLRQTASLPDPRLPAEEYYQPPLFYTLAALITLPVDDSDFEATSQRTNPYHLTHQPDRWSIPGNDNKNRLIHSREEAFPYTGSGTALDVHLARLVSVAAGVGTLIAVYAVFRMIWPAHTHLRLLALAVTAFWPQFVFMSAMINNDALSFCLASVSLLLVLRQLRDGPMWRRSILLGVALGAGLLAKVSLGLLAVPVGLAVLMDLRRAWRHAVLILALALAIGGWWYLRNFLLFGEPTAIGAMYTSWPALRVAPGTLTFRQALDQLALVYARLWARFGANTIAMPPILYRFFDALTLVGLAGFIYRLAQRTRRRERIARHEIVLAAFGLALLAAIVTYTLTNRAGNQGRFLLPGILIWAAILAAGLDALFPARFKVGMAAGSSVVLAAVAVVCLIGYTLPAYRPSPVPAQIAHPLYYNYEGVAELIGIDTNNGHGHPGDAVTITLYWRALTPTATSLQTYVHSAGAELVRRDSLPATGNLLSTEWQAGQTWAEEYVIILPEGERQIAYPLVAGLYDPQAGRTLTARDSAGNVVTPTVGRVALNGPAESIESDYVFGRIIGLQTPERISVSGGEVAACLRWNSLAAAPLDYTVFVQLLDGAGVIVAQDDHEPRGGPALDYALLPYPTGLWLTGEVVEDCRLLISSEPPGEGWTIAVGLYDPATGARLPAEDQNGQRLPNDAVILNVSQANR